MKGKYKGKQKPKKNIVIKWRGNRGIEREKKYLFFIHLWKENEEKWKSITIPFHFFASIKFFLSKHSLRVCSVWLEGFYPRERKGTEIVLHFPSISERKVILIFYMHLSLASAFQPNIAFPPLTPPSK